jgi:carboxypeptidase T
MKYFFWLFVLCFFVLGANAQQPQYAKVRIDVASGGGAQALASLGIEVDHGHWEGRAFFTHYFAIHELDLIAQAGFSYVVEIPDVMAEYKRMQADGPPAGYEGTARYETCDPSRRTGDYTTPTNYQAGSMGGYPNYDEMLTQLHAMHLYRPDLITDTVALSDSIVTFEGRRLYHLRISDNPGVDEDEPEVLYTSLHHAREPNSMTELLFFMWYLLENYDTDPEIKYIVDETDLFFVPCVNPDGFVFNGQTEPNGNGMWRKNRRNNGDGTFGVDLNRNYGYLWGYDDTGSSSITDAETYRGTAPFSEPETKLIRNLCNAHEFSIAHNHHTYSNVFLFAWGHTFDAAPDRPQMEVLAQEMVRQSGWDYGSAELLYLLNGNSDDWMYGDTTTKGRIFAHTPELGSGDYGFWPPSWDIDRLNKVAMHMNLSAALLIHPAVALDALPPILSNTTGNTLPFRIRRTGVSDGPITVSLTALTNNVTINTPPMVYNLPVLGVEENTFSFLPNPSAANGEPMGFVLSWTNDLFAYHDTLFILNGEALVLAEDDGLNTLFVDEGALWVDAIGDDGQPEKIAKLYGQQIENQIETLTDPVGVMIPDTGQTWLTYEVKHHIIGSSGSLSLLGGPSSDIFLCGDKMLNTEFNNYKPAHQGLEPYFFPVRINITDFAGEMFKMRFQTNFRETPFEISLRNFRIETVSAATSSQDFLTQGASIYPNPSHGLVTITTPFAGLGDLQVWGLDGITRYQAKNQTLNKLTFDVSLWPTGIYPVQVRRADGFIIWGKLMVND